MGNLKHWWDSLGIMGQGNIIRGGPSKLFYAIISKFIGNIVYQKKTKKAQFLSQKICDLTLRTEYYHTMQDILYNFGSYNGSDYEGLLD